MRRLLFVLFALSACRARAPEPRLEPSTHTPKETMAKSDGEPGSSGSHVVPSRLVLGLLPIFEPEQLQATYRPLADYLAEELKTEVSIKLTDTYDAMVDAVLRGEIDIVQLAPLTYVVAKQKDKTLELIATNIAEGSSTYSGYILTRTDSPIHTAEDFRHKRFGFVDPTSSSGYLYAYAFFLEQGILPERDFQSLVMTKRHDLAIEALLRGDIDGTATFSGALLNAEALGLDSERLRILAKTGRIPYDAWCVRGSLEPWLKKQIQNTLLGLSTRTLKGRQVLGPIRSINGFTLTSDASYDEIRRLKHLVDAAHD